MNEVKKALKNQILKAVNNKYLQDLEDRLFSYANVTPRAMLTHLIEKYDRCCQSDKLKEPWEPTKDIKMWMKLRKREKNLKIWF